MGTSQNCCCQCLCPCSEAQPPHASAGDPPILACLSGPVSYGVTAFFPWVLVCKRLCVSPPWVEFPFSSVLWQSCDQTLLAFKARFFGDSSSHWWTPRLGSLMWGSELLLLWGNFSGIIVFQFMCRPPGGYGIWFYCSCVPPTVSLWLLLCLWMYSIFFGRFQHFFVGCCSAVSCNFGVFVRGVWAHVLLLRHLL